MTFPGNGLPVGFGGRMDIGLILRCIAAGSTLAAMVCIAAIYLTGREA